MGIQGSNRAGRLRRKRMRRVVLLLVIVVCVWLWRAAILQGIARILIVDQPQATPDYVWIRSGDRCYDRAAELYHEDTSRCVVLIKQHPRRSIRIGAAPCFEVVVRRELGARGVPNDAIVTIDGKPRTRREEAGLLDMWMGGQHAARVLLLCSRFQSRPWRCVLDDALKPDHAAKVELLALPDRRYDETNWWNSRRGVKCLFDGYVSLTYTWCHADDVSKDDSWDPDDYEQQLVQPPAREL